MSPNGSYFVDALSQDIAEAEAFSSVKDGVNPSTVQKTCQTQTSLKTDVSAMRLALLCNRRTNTNVNNPVV